jgi:tetratricopeptide (TPR) repeat protein
MCNSERVTLARLVRLVVPLGALVVAFTLPPAWADQTPAAAPAKVNAQLVARADELWKRRDDPASLAEMKKLLDRGLAEAPQDYDILWRGSVYYFWVSDDPSRSSEERARMGKQGWEIAQRAVAANPAGVEGHFFAATTIGNYSLGIGVLRALAQRLEGKFTGQLSEAERIEPGFAHAAIPVVWGRYHATLPWPKYDAKKAVAQFQRALKMNPNNLRARVYWAEVMLEEGQPQEAKRLCDEVLAAQPGRYDAPEERRSQVIARMLLPRITAKLK